MTAFIFGVWLSGPLPVKFLVVGKGDGEEDAFLRKVFGRLSPWGVEKRGNQDSFVDFWSQSSLNYLFVNFL